MWTAFKNDSDSNDEATVQVDSVLIRNRISREKNRTFAEGKKLS